MNNIKMTNHIYVMEVTLNGKVTRGIGGDDIIDDAINTIYNEDNEQEEEVRRNLRLLKAGLIPGLVINDMIDGGTTKIVLIK